MNNELRVGMPTEREQEGENLYKHKREAVADLGFFKGWPILGRRG